MMKENQSLEEQQAKKEKFDIGFYKEIVNRSQTNIYITDIETDEIIYMNDFMKKTFHLSNPEGEICWKVLQKDQDQRCEFCKIEQLLNDAAIDELTTLLNRKAGRQKLSEILKSLKENEQLIIALYDINGLKWVNDTFGHHEGDRLLHYVATQMKDEMEEDDFMFRLSGDEFIVVFRNKELYQADHWMKTMLEFLREEKSEAEIDYEVSFSYGLAKISGRDHLNVSDALALADTQMYIQKRDYHIQKRQEKLFASEDEKYKERKEFEYNREYLFDAFSETTDGYAFIGNLKTGEFMYSYKMVWDFGLPGQVLKEAAAFWGTRIHPDDKEFFLRSNQEIADGKADRHTIAYRAKNAKNQWVNLLCKGRMIRDEEGRPDIFAGVIRNLDNREERRNLSASARSSFYFMNQAEGEEQIEVEQYLMEFVNSHIPGGVIATKDDERSKIKRVCCWR